MTRRTLTHNLPKSQRHDWGYSPLNARQSLRMALYWHDRRHKLPRPQCSTRGKLWDIAADRRTAGVIAINDQRHVVSGPYRRWEQENWKHLMSTLTPAVGEP